MSARRPLLIAAVALVSVLPQACNLSPGLDLPTFDEGNGGSPATGGSSGNTGGAPAGGSGGSFEAELLVPTGGASEGGASSEEGGAAGALAEDKP